MGKFIDLTGKKFGSLSVRERLPNKKKWTMWRCLCDCGNEHYAYSTHLIEGNTTSCGCARIKIGDEHAQWSGCGEISGQRWNRIKRANKSRKSRLNHTFNIDAEYAWNLFIKQNRKCALSGVEIYFGKRNTDDCTASLDRINSKFGYVVGNVQWVHKDVNRMKNTFDQKYFVDMCKKIAGVCEI